eukprot:jgi/Mesvir1/27610/Mv07345-RA.1
MPAIPARVVLALLASVVVATSFGMWSYMLSRESHIAEIVELKLKLESMTYENEKVVALGVRLEQLNEENADLKVKFKRRQEREAKTHKEEVDKLTEQLDKCEKLRLAAYTQLERVATAATSAGGVASISSSSSSAGASGSKGAGGQNTSATLEALIKQLTSEKSVLQKRLTSEEAEEEDCETQLAATQSSIHWLTQENERLEAALEANTEADGNGTNKKSTLASVRGGDAECHAAMDSLQKEMQVLRDEKASLRRQLADAPGGGAAATTANANNNNGAGCNCDCSSSTKPVLPVGVANNNNNSSCNCGSNGGGAGGAATNPAGGGSSADTQELSELRQRLTAALADMARCDDQLHRVFVEDHGHCDATRLDSCDVTCPFSPAEGSGFITGDGANNSTADAECTPRTWISLDLHQLLGAWMPHFPRKCSPGLYEGEASAGGRNSPRANLLRKKVTEALVSSITQRKGDQGKPTPGAALLTPLTPLRNLPGIAEPGVQVILRGALEAVLRTPEMGPYARPLRPDLISRLLAAGSTLGGLVDGLAGPFCDSSHDGHERFKHRMFQGRWVAVDSSAVAAPTLADLDAAGGSNNGSFGTSGSGSGTRGGVVGSAASASSTSVGASRAQPSDDVLAADALLFTLQLYADSRSLRTKSHWLGHATGVNPWDAVAHQMLLEHLNPALVVQVGAGFGGGHSLFIASVLELLAAGAPFQNQPHPWANTNGNANSGLPGGNPGGRPWGFNVPGGRILTIDNKEREKNGSGEAASGDGDGGVVATTFTEAFAHPLFQKRGQLLHGLATDPVILARVREAVVMATENPLPSATGGAGASGPAHNNPGVGGLNYGGAGVKGLPGKTGHVVVFVNPVHSSADALRAILDAYAPLVTGGSFLVVQETVRDRAAPEGVQGPFVIVQEFLARGVGVGAGGAGGGGGAGGSMGVGGVGSSGAARPPLFAVDRSFELAGLSNSPQGYLHRLEGGDAATQARADLAAQGRVGPGAGWVSASAAGGAGASSGSGAAAVAVAASAPAGTTATAAVVVAAFS